jgi:site-specific recombinase XerD
MSWRKYGGKFGHVKGELIEVQAKLTQTFVNSVPPSGKLMRIRDTVALGLVLFVNAGGKKTYFVDFHKSNGKRADYKLGDATRLTVAEARDLTRTFLAAVERGDDPTTPRDDTITLGAFVNDIYEPWVTENRKSGDLTVEIIRTHFKHLFDVPLDSLTVAQIEQWRSKKKKAQGVKASSLNREVTALKAALNWAVKRGIIEANPIAKLESLPERDSVKIVRYLTAEERERLVAALDEREKEMREARDSHNRWLAERGLNTLPPIGAGRFADYLKPIVIMSLKTGIRRGSMLALEWGDVNLADRMVKVRAAVSKTDKEYYVPLCDLAFDVLSRWREQSPHTSPHSLVFPSPTTGKKMDTCAHPWNMLLKRAGIENFRWHDMRHDFASQLVMAGVDLNTVRELMGHADLKMTLRYAHLAPENKLQAVRALDGDSFGKNVECRSA